MKSVLLYVEEDVYAMLKKYAEERELSLVTAINLMIKESLSKELEEV